MLTIAIDIDGVISPVVNQAASANHTNTMRSIVRSTSLSYWLTSAQPVPEYHCWPQDQYRWSVKVMFGTFVAEPVIQLLHELDANPDVQILWHSSWRLYAADELAPFIGVGQQWPQFATEAEYNGRYSGWWKQRAVSRWLRTHASDPSAHLLWIDDDIKDADDVLETLGAHPQLTMISPQLRLGLTPEHVEQIRELVRTHDRPSEEGAA